MAFFKLLKFFNIVRLADDLLRKFAFQRVDCQDMFLQVNRFVYSRLFRFECFLINKGIGGLRSLWPFLTKEGGVFSCSRLFVVEILLAIQLAFDHGCG